MQSLKKCNSEMTHALWWTTKSMNPILRLFTSTQFLTYAFPIKDLKKIATIFASRSNNIQSINAAEDKMSMCFSWKFRHNTTNWFALHTGMKSYFQMHGEQWMLTTLKGRNCYIQKWIRMGGTKNVVQTMPYLVIMM